MKSGPSAMYGPKAMKDKGAMAMKDKGAMAMKKGPMAMSGEKYDAKEAYNKNLTASARLHYLENERHDKTHMAKIQPHKRGATAMYGKGPKAMHKGPKAMREDARKNYKKSSKSHRDSFESYGKSKTDKGIKGLGSSNKSGGKYI